ncbi:hypothetical protein FKM82_005726 [Ascaphus truei]
MSIPHPHVNVNLPSTHLVGARRWTQLCIHPQSPRSSPPVDRRSVLTSQVHLDPCHGFPYYPPVSYPRSQLGNLLR